MIRWKNTLFRKGFTAVPSVVVTRNDLSHGAQRLYALLCFYARDDDQAWPGQAGLARLMKINERSLRSYFRELEREGLIHIRRRGQGKTNVYTLLDNGRRKGPVPEVAETPDLNRAKEPGEVDAVEVDTEELRSSGRQRAVDK